MRRTACRQASKLADPTTPLSAWSFYTPVEPFKILVLERTNRKVVTTEDRSHYSLLPALQESVYFYHQDAHFASAVSPMIQGVSRPDSDCFSKLTTVSPPLATVARLAFRFRVRPPRSDKSNLSDP